MCFFLFLTSLILSKNLLIDNGAIILFFKSKEDIIKAATKYVKTFKDIPYVFNLGHGLLPETDPDKVKMLINFYRNYNG